MKCPLYRKEHQPGNVGRAPAQVLQNEEYVKIVLSQDIVSWKIFVYFQA